MPRVATALAAVLALSTAPALAHQPGLCLTPTERCETWSATYDDTSIAAPARSDQFVQQVLANATTVFTVARSVAMTPSKPSDATSSAVIVAYDRVSGAVRWTARERSRVYFSPHHAVLSPDGARLYLTSAAYDGWPVGDVDSRIVTTAYSTASGAALWSSSWDGRPDAVDNPKGIVVSPDGRSVFVTGVTSAAAGDLDYVTLAYRATDGREQWSDVYAGVGGGGTDAPFGIAVSPRGDVLAVTGWSAGVVEYDADYGTVAYSLKGRGGKRLWTARYDGLGVDKSDRGNAVAIDGDRVYVTGDSYGASGYDYATVAYKLSSGQQVWDSRWSGGRGGFNAATAVAAAGGRVVVTGQSTAASADDGNDAGTVVLDAVSGAKVWAASFGPARHDGFARGLALSPDGKTAYVVTLETPIVKYTAMSRLGLVAYDVATGAVRWQTFLDAALTESLKGSDVAVSPDGSVAVAGDYTRSADPLKGPEQNVYDVVTAVF
jgi:WD40 repeat protein